MLFSIIARCVSAFKLGWRLLGAFWKTFRILNHSSPLRDVEQNVPSVPILHSEEVGYRTFAITIRNQPDLDIIGVGGEGLVYGINSQIVLKASKLYTAPSDPASPREQWIYASKTLFHATLAMDERTVYQFLEKHPHPNLVEAVDITRAEGVYLRRYMPCPDPSFYGQSRRIRWYQDIIRAILHLHGLGLTHSDLHRGNVFLNHNGQAVLGDFGGCCRYGVENPFVAAPENGYAKTVTDASDRFAMGSLIYEMETGARPKITADENGNLVFPCIYTGHGGIDLLIDNAWLGRYASTADMLAHAEELMTDAAPSIHGMVQQAVSKKELRAQVKKWREGREKEHGWVLYGLPTEHEMRQMADKVGWKMEEERKFGKLSRT